MHVRKSTIETRQWILDYVSLVMTERTNYRIKQDIARIYLAQFSPVIVDGADQSPFRPPHFVTSMKDVRGRALKVRLIEVLQHLKPNKLHSLNMTKEHETGANHNVENIHRFLPALGPQDLSLQLLAFRWTSAQEGIRIVISFLTSSL